jgi:hypothetical protein
MSSNKRSDAARTGIFSDGGVLTPQPRGSNTVGGGSSEAESFAKRSFPWEYDEHHQSPRIGAFFSVASGGGAEDGVCLDSWCQCKVCMMEMSGERRELWRLIGDHLPKANCNL